MTNEKNFAAYSVLGNMADDLIMDALLAEDKGVAAIPVRKERSRRLSAFFESGWSVAIICALVAVSVMGGIIWAGNRPGPVTPPAGTVEPESDPVTQEILTDESQESPAETSEPETVFVPTETTRSCTLLTDKDRYEWDSTNCKFYATLTSTEAGAILDIGDESWQLHNLETGEYVPVAWAVVDYGVTTNANGDRSLIIPNSSTAFAKYQNVLRFDWEITPPGRYRLTYTGVELAEGEEYPYCDFEIYDPEAHPEGIYVQGGGDYVVPKEAMLWVEFWDEATGTMLSGDGSGHSNLQDYASELPMLTVREGLAMDVMNAEISYCVLYDQNFEILYEGKEWINTTDYVIGPFYVVFTVRTQGKYIEEVDAYEGSAHEYAFCLNITPYCDGSCAETELPYFVETTPNE